MPRSISLIALATTLSALGCAPGLDLDHPLSQGTEAGDVVSAGDTFDDVDDREDTIADTAPDDSVAGDTDDPGDTAAGDVTDSDVADSDVADSDVTDSDVSDSDVGCPDGGAECDGLCIELGRCCDDEDCTDDLVCSAPGGTCVCPPDRVVCGDTCLPAGSCCTDDECGALFCQPDGSCGCIEGERLCGDACITVDACCALDCPTGFICGRADSCVCRDMDECGQREVLVAAGTFTMGSPESEANRSAQEVEHPVTLTHAIWVLETEVTQGDYRALMGESPSLSSACGDACPVDQVSWLEAVAYANALSTAYRLEPCYDIVGGEVTPTSTSVYACEGYRLPTEAEWEYFARAGTSTPWSCGSDEGCVEDIGWIAPNSADMMHPVGLKAANAWGLYDTTGNVWEFTWDRWANYDGDAEDPTGPETGTSRVIRGGAYDTATANARSAQRATRDPELRGAGIGFRLCRTDN